MTDRYPEISIKNPERSRRAGSGTQLLHLYSSNQKTPSQWKKFLSSGENKEALIDFLYETWKDAHIEVAGRDIDIFVTHRELCLIVIKLCSGVVNVTKVDSLTSDHEEADTRLLLHARHACDELYDKIIICSPDTDVAIITLSLMEKMSSAKLYFLTGTKDKHRMIDLQVIANALGPNLSAALIGLHSFTGCDSTSAFYGKGKEKALKLTTTSVPFKLLARTSRQIVMFL